MCSFMWFLREPELASSLGQSGHCTCDTKPQWFSFFNTWTLLLFQNVLSQCVAPSEAVRKFSCCSGAGGGCVGRGGVRMPCRSARTRKVFLRCGGPCAPSGPVSGRRPCHSGDRRRDAPRGDSTVNHTSIILHY